MVDLRDLERRAYRAAEWGRARSAARVAFAVLPMAIAAGLAGGSAEVCACLGGLLFLAAAGLRFSGRAGVDAVRIGLAMGLVPLGATLVLRACGIPCPEVPGVGVAEAACALAGVVAGAGVAVWASGDAGAFRTWASATGVASAAAALGCVGLGAGGAAVTLVSLVAASITVGAPLQALARRPT